MKQLFQYAVILHEYDKEIMNAHMNTPKKNSLLKKYVLTATKNTCMNPVVNNFIESLILFFL